jgi:hypothetical protein
MSCVYALVSTEDPTNIRYIGISKYDTPDNRLARHLSSAKSSNSSIRNLPIYKWINKHTLAGHEIHYILLETGLSWDEACYLEIEQIKDHKNIGYDLLNMTDGGEGTLGSIRSEESREKARAYWTDERRAKQRENTKSRAPHVFTDEEKEQLKQSATARHEALRNSGLIWGVDLGPIDKTTKEVKERIVFDHQAGKSYRKIAKELNDEKIPTAQGKTWYPSSVKNIYDRYSV